MLKFTHKGNFNKIEKFFIRMSGAQYLNILEKYGREGVAALSAATPVDSGETASGWTFEIERGSSSTTISWSNTHSNDGVNIAVILQYGHGTGTGGYVQGIDYINPAMARIFDNIAKQAWKEVTMA